MKILMVGFTLILAGCASAPSEYGQGCRDGLGSVVHILENSRINDECDRLESRHNRQERAGGHRE